MVRGTVCSVNISAFFRKSTVDDNTENQETNEKMILVIILWQFVRCNNTMLQLELFSKYNCTNT